MEVWKQCSVFFCEPFVFLSRIFFTYLVFICISDKVPHSLWNEVEYDCYDHVCVYYTLSYPSQFFKVILAGFLLTRSPHPSSHHVYLFDPYIFISFCHPALPWFRESHCFINIMFFLPVSFFIHSVPMEHV